MNLDLNSAISMEICGTVNDKLEDVIDLYLSILDHQQNEIYDVRMMHHEVWRDVHQVAGISETRAGSRVERYTKVLPIGSKSDVDYKLCVQGLEIEDHIEGNLYFVSCPSRAYCKLYITDKGMAVLEENVLLSKFYKNAVFKCPDSGKLMVKPAILKTNVVEHCNFEMRKTADQSSPTSPAVSGEGALNPYDIVPCLKLKTWPNFIRRRVLEMYTFKLSTGEPVPVFIVPTGHPLSQSRDVEWRFSFAILEIEIFKQLKNHQRRLYGLVKYIFKVVFEDLELIQSYHLKILFLRKLENDDLTNVKPLAFLLSFFQYILDAVEKQYIPHLFIEECNIYPVHYYSNRKRDQFRIRVVNSDFLFVVRNKIKEIISHDTRTEIAEWDCWLESVEQVLEAHQKAGLSKVWIDGYLTRLFSVIVYCIQKSRYQNKHHNAITNLVKLMQDYHHDIYISRVIPHIRCLLDDVYHMDMCSAFGTESVKSCDRVSFVIHKAFYCYEQNDIEGVIRYLTEVEDAGNSSETIGITVTKFHKGIDQPLDFVIDYCRDKLNANRFYLCPNVICLHIKIQLRIRKINHLLEQTLTKNKELNNPTSLKLLSAYVKDNGTIMETYDHETSQTFGDIDKLVTELINAAAAASIREPYTGKLSYKHASLLLLMGYEEQLSRSAVRALREIQLNFKPDFALYSKTELTTNFDLR